MNKVQSNREGKWRQMDEIRVEKNKKKVLVLSWNGMKEEMKLKGKLFQMAGTTQELDLALKEPNHTRK